MGTLLPSSRILLPLTLSNPKYYRRWPLPILSQNRIKPQLFEKVWGDPKVLPTSLLTPCSPGSMDSWASSTALSSRHRCSLLLLLRAILAGLANTGNQYKIPGSASFWSPLSLLWLLPCSCIYFIFTTYLCSYLLTHLSPLPDCELLGVRNCLVYLYIPSRPSTALGTMWQSVFIGGKKGGRGRKREERNLRSR